MATRTEERQATSRLSSVPRSRTPRGRPASHRSLSKEEPEQSLQATSSKEKPRRGRPPKHGGRKPGRPALGRDETASGTSRKRRRGRVRKRVRWTFLGFIKNFLIKILFIDFV